MEKKNLLILSFLSLLLISILSINCKQESKNDKKAKYIFYLIGDGMGEAQVALTEAYLASVAGEVGMKHLKISDFPVLGFQASYAEDRLITGSAASGTALATGHKTSIGRISISQNLQDTLYSLAQAAQKAGMKTGILTNVGINHATPAVFYANQELRNQYYEIGRQLPKRKFDLFGGGGFIDPKGKDTDTLPDNYAFAEENGYKIIRTADEFKTFAQKDQAVFMVAEDILSHAEMPYAIDRKDGMPSIADYAAKAIELLENPKGFFIMIEGGKIDWAAHANDAAAMVQEVIDFDKVVQAAFKFYEKHPDETLIVITADHETGGLAIGNNELGYESNLALLKKQKASLDALNNQLAKFFKENNAKKNYSEAVFELCYDFFGISKTDLTDAELRKLEEAYRSYMIKKEDEKMTYSTSNPIVAAWLEVFNTKAGVGWTTHAHTAIPVPVRAVGVGQELFNGFYDNTDIPKKIAKTANLTLK